MKSYALGEIPSLSDRITIVRQLWDLTRDVLVCATITISVCDPSKHALNHLIVLSFSDLFSVPMMDDVLWRILVNIVILFKDSREHHHNAHISRESWPLDGMEFETLKERHAKRNPEDLIIDYGS
ncbi:hypothetical protein BHE74_00012966 [Ensete ventricosum]|uniref:Uncharacterized protein n=1 Tax=Ensete ventricosum TaxID=4639 RepID=A0A427B162_ENSVE|nr:hypothetical protein B296_00013319 [Ensete ventricosum]RWW78796.1 hypothetical protein BHE74_00012966 [Ensete ventricosum]